MKNRTLIAAAILILAALTASLIWGRAVSAKNSGASAEGSARDSRKAHPQTKDSQGEDWLVSGAGRVEPVSEDIKMGAELSGRLKTVFVEEGQPVHAGQVLAELVNEDYRAQVESAEAQVRQKEAELRKVFNGARREERREALSSVEEAQAVMANAEAEMRRHQKLFEAGVISQEEADRYTKEYEVAKAQYRQRVENHTLIDEETREEDRAMARANLEDAKARLAEARALYAKTFIRSPIDGTVLRRHHRAGESVSNGLTNPDPIFALGDTHTLRVRVDVDETDVRETGRGTKGIRDGRCLRRQEVLGPGGADWAGVGEEEYPHGRADRTGGHKDSGDVDSVRRWCGAADRAARGLVYSDGQRGGAGRVRGSSQFRKLRSSPLGWTCRSRGEPGRPSGT